MSGWQRLGIVLSVLWTITCPIWLVIDTNTRASHDFESCLHLAGSISDDYENADKRAQVYDRMSNRCQHTYLASTTSLSQMIADEDNKKFLARMIGGPIAATWLLSSIVIVTFRWISRGFKRA
jgi:hypothetical protein